MQKVRENLLINKHKLDPIQSHSSSLSPMNKTSFLLDYNQQIQKTRVKEKRMIEKIILFEEKKNKYFDTQYEILNKMKQTEEEKKKRIKTLLKEEALKKIERTKTKIEMDKKNKIEEKKKAIEMLMQSIKEEKENIVKKKQNENKRKSLSKSREHKRRLKLEKTKESLHSLQLINEEKIKKTNEKSKILEEKILSFHHVYLI